MSLFQPQTLLMLKTDEESSLTPSVVNMEEHQKKKMSPHHHHIPYKRDTEGTESFLDYEMVPFRTRIRTSDYYPSERFSQERRGEGNPTNIEPPYQEGDISSGSNHYHLI